MPRYKFNTKSDESITLHDELCYYLCFLWNELHVSLFFNVSSQSMEATHSGLLGLSVVNLAVQESNVVIVPAQILGQHTKDDGVAILGHGENHRYVTFGPVQVQCLTLCHTIKLLKAKAWMNEYILFLSQCLHKGSVSQLQGLLVTSICFHFSVDGSFSDWSSWSQCSVTCHNGTQQRNRSCSNPPPANGGKQCEGSTQETQICSYEMCPKQGKRLLVFKSK